MLSFFSHGFLYLKSYKSPSIQRRMICIFCKFIYLIQGLYKRKRCHLEDTASLALWADLCTQYRTPVKSDEVLQRSLQTQFWGAIFSIVAKPVSRYTSYAHSSSDECWKKLTKIWWCAIVHRDFRRSSSMQSSKCRALPNSVPAIFKTNWLKFVISTC